MMQSVGQGTAIWTDDDCEAFHEEADRQTTSLIVGFLDGRKALSWSRIPARRLFKVWTDFAKTGIVRDEKGMGEIAEQTMKNIVRLHVANAMCGHDRFGPEDLWENVGFDYSEIDEDQFMTYLTDPASGDPISDYGLPYLYPLWHEIRNAESAEEQLYAVDRVLNVVHQRSDLASWFVEGGTRTLQKISDHGTTPDPTEDIGALLRAADSMAGVHGDLSGALAAGMA